MIGKKGEGASRGSNHVPPLSGAACLKVQHLGRVWFILDQARKYSVRMVPTVLLVYSEML